jgi:hypothetical protein
MKALLTFALLAGTLHAQVAGGRAAGGVVFANPGGYGNVAYPGTGRPSVSAAGQQTGLRNGLGGRRNSASAYGYPVFVGGGYYDQGGYGTQQQQQQPNITIINNPPPPAAAPVVVINQNFAPPPQIGDEGSTEATHIFQPQRREVEAASDQSGSAAPHYFLIAYKDHSVYSALAYWVEDKTMHYVTPQQTHNQASLDLIDMDFTKKLNQR